MNGWSVLFFGRHPRRTLLRALLLALLTLAAGLGPARPMRVRGHSMEPTIRDGGWRVANLWRYANREPRRGDVVVIALPGGRAYYCKRVVGLPGERVAFQDGALYVNDDRVPEPYIAATGRWSVAPYGLGPDEYYVVGDNRNLSMSDQVAGVVKRKFIAGGIW